MLNRFVYSVALCYFYALIFYRFFLLMNTARIKLFGAIYFAIEIIIFVLIGLVIGFGWAILLILAPIVIGGYLLKSHAQALLQAQRTSNVGMSAMLPA